MKQHNRRWLTAILVLAAMMLPAWAETLFPAEISDVQESNDVPLVAPAFTVEVSRSGKTLQVVIMAESYGQQTQLFGEKWDRKPTLAIYQGDVLLESGSFAFG